MNKLIFAVLLIGLVGCTKEPQIVGDQKPVAPTTYQEGKVEKTDPQLPPMVPHWKEDK